MAVTPHRAVFLSYAHDDSEAARRVADALREGGVEVWFDQNELRGGDAWDSKIRNQVKECALFMPIISANTQARPEGYFRLEWHLAQQRSHLIAQGRPFIVPICVDDTPDAEALVPDAFLAVQWMRLPGGKTDPAFCERVKFLLAGGDRSEGSRSRPPIRAATTPPIPAARQLPGWVRPVLASSAIAVAVLAYNLWYPKKADAEKSAAPAPAVATAQPALTPARELIHRVQQILDPGALSRSRLDAAEELCDSALQRDPTDPLVWAKAAEVELLYVYPYGFDISETRRRRAEERAAKAFNLGPDLPAVRLIQAEVFAHAVKTPALIAEAEKMIRSLSAQDPGNPELVRQLAEVLREENHFDEAAQLFERIGSFEVAGWSYFQGGKLRLALSAVEKSPRSVTALQLRAILEYSVNEDLDAAKAVVDQWQPSELLNEMPAFIAMTIALYQRNSGHLLELSQAISSDFIDTNAFRGPTKYFTGLAYEMANQPVQAEAEWRAALGVVQTLLKAKPDDRVLLEWSAWLHGALHETSEAESSFAHSQALAGLKGDAMDLSNLQDTLLSLHVLLRLQKKEAVLAGLEKLFQEKRPTWELIHSDARFNPQSDFLQGDSRFEKLMRDHLPEGAKPYSSADYKAGSKT